MTPIEFRLSLTNLRWMLAALTLVIAPHAEHLPWWTLLAFGFFTSWRYLASTRGWRLPPNYLTVLFGVGVMLGILLSYHTIFGRDAGVALLVGLVGLKLLEMRNLRDALLLLFLAYFLIITNFLYSQSIPTALYLFLLVLVITATLVGLSDRVGGLPTRKRFRLAATLLLQALPLMLALFLLFPRIEGPFWRLPKDAYSGVSGLTDSMSPGSIGQLSLSDAAAFRVRFQGPLPPPEQRYWRGPVLWWTNGRTWRASAGSFEPPPPLWDETDPVQYTVTLEAHDQPWLYALDLPEAAPEGRGYWLSPDYQVRTRLPVRQRLRYSLRSYTGYNTGDLSPSERGIALRLPKGKHPRALDLAQQWRQQYAQPRQIVDAALNYFHQQAFVYTLQPPLLPDDPVDQFLFDTRRGFCEHYASAFTVLMRAAGVPARVVTGYQGGELNTLGDYLLVRQRDAHAWSEVWLPGQGWVRVDPTSAVSPSRIERGVDAALPEDFAPLLLWSRDSALAQTLEQVRNGWDALNSGWDEWVLGYGSQQQQDLLRQLGLPDLSYRDLAHLLLGVLVALLLPLMLWLLWPRTPRSRDPVQRAYLRFCAKLGRRGIIREPHEGPLAFARRAAALCPQRAPQIEAITQFYIELRYRNRDGLEPQRLLRQVQQFRL